MTGRRLFAAPLAALALAAACRTLAPPPTVEPGGPPKAETVPPPPPPAPAAPGEIASKREIDRADLAALLVRELNVAEVLGETEAPPAAAPAAPTDVAGHPYEKEIAAAVALRVRGLEPGPSGAFAPGRAVRRADLAVVLEGILARVTGEASLPRRFLTGPSPFADVDEDHFAYTAIVVAATRGLLWADADGEFHKDRIVSGREAAEALARLRDKIAEARASEEP